MRVQLEQGSCTGTEVGDDGAYAFNMPIDNHNKMVDAAAPFEIFAYDVPGHSSFEANTLS